ncbi:MAG: hypothetical protein IIB00_06495 [candidate division Zixibacteria bacterium]|nr:hypothetical protein [candidate division Zixibacteria bacterium]
MRSGNELPVRVARTFVRVSEPDARVSLIPTTAITDHGHASAKQILIVRTTRALFTPRGY